MREDLTKVVFILDRSGSMMSLTDDTIGGFNSFIEDQKKQDGEVLLTTVLFDDKYEVLHDNINIQDVKPLSSSDYYARGMTAMMDTIGRTINEVGAKLNKMNEDEKPSKVIFVITTDGCENASREFRRHQIKEMIELQTEKYNWEFLFLGANIDSASTAEGYGISTSRSANYSANEVGTDSLYKSVSATVCNFRSSGKVSKGWAKGIQ